MKRSDLKLTPAPGGWIHADWGDGRAWVRFGLDEENRLTRPTEVHVLEPTAERLRRVPLGRIQAAVTARGSGLIQFMLAVGINTEPPPGMLSTPPDKFGEFVEKHKPRYRLKRPAGRRLDDTFFANVALAYRDAASRMLNPRQTIAADTGAAPDTVAGWVQEARRRGHLPPGQPGKVTA